MKINDIKYTIELILVYYYDCPTSDSGYEAYIYKGDEYLNSLTPWYDWKGCECKERILDAVKEIIKRDLGYTPVENIDYIINEDIKYEGDEYDKNETDY